MKKIQYNGSSKILIGIVTKINLIIDKLVVDVKVNGTSVVVVNEDGEREADIDLSLADQNVKQSPTTSSDNSDYRVLLSKSANDTEETDISRKDTNLKYNPSTGNLQTTKLNGNTVPSGSGNDTLAKTSDIPTVNPGSVFGSLSFDGTDKIVKLSADAQGSGKNLNDYKTEGFYYFDSNNIPTNIPTGNVNGFLAVIKSGNVVKQFWFRQGSETTQANTYVRLFISSSSTWTTWRKYATTDDIPIVTDEKVKQTAVSSSSNENYRLLLSKSANDTEETDGVYKDGSLYYNPYDDKVTVQNVDISNTANIATAKVTSLITSQYYFNLGSGNAVAMLEANSASTTSNPTFVTLPASSGTLALQSESVLWSHNNLLGAKNLIPFNTTEKSHTQNNVQFTLNEDGSIKAHITGTGSGGTFDVTTKADENLILPNGTYIFSGCPSGGSNTKYRCRVKVYNITTGTESSYGFDTGSGVTVTVNETEGKGIIEIACLIYSGYNGSDLLFKPMIRPSSIADDTYTPPSQTNRQLTTDKVNWNSYAKNLIPYPWSTEARNGRVNRGITFTYDEEGYVTLNGTADANSQPYMCYTLATDAATQMGNGLVIEGNKKYTLSIDRTDDRLFAMIYIRNTSGTSASVATRAVFEDGTVRELTSDYISLNYSGVIHRSVTFEILTSGSYRLQVDLRVSNNSGTYTNAKGRVMLRCTDSGDDTWVKYAKSNYELTTLKAEYKQIATIENETTASRAYAKNELMIWYGNLYRVTTAISSGGAISGKVTATTLSAEIKAIRDALNI